MEELETGVKLDEGAAPAPSTQPDPASGAPAPAASGQPSTDGGVTPGGEKRYTQAEVQAILHERTRGMSQIRKEYETYRSLGTLEELQAKLKPAPAAQPQDDGLEEDDRKFKAYLAKVYPGLKKLDEPSPVTAEHLQFIQGLQAREAKAHERYMESTESEIYKHCDANKITDETHRRIMRDAIASVILNDPALAQRFEQRDPGTVSDAVKLFQRLNPGMNDIAAAQAAAAAKGKAGGIKAGMPSGGVAAPITKDKKLSDEERLDQAWKSLQGQK